jgi:hypothetical protein
MGKNPFQPRPLVGRHESTDRLPGHFFCGIAVNAFGPLAPGVDGAIEGDAEDGVLGGFEKSGEQVSADLTMGHGNRTIFLEGGKLCY